MSELNIKQNPDPLSGATWQWGDYILYEVFEFDATKYTNKLIYNFRVDGHILRVNNINNNFFNNYYTTIEYLVNNSVILNNMIDSNVDLISYNEYEIKLLNKEPVLEFLLKSPPPPKRTICGL